MDPHLSSACLRSAWTPHFWACLLLMFGSLHALVPDGQKDNPVRPTPSVLPGALITPEITANFTPVPNVAHGGKRLGPNHAAMRTALASWSMLLCALSAVSVASTAANQLNCTDKNEGCKCYCELCEKLNMTSSQIYEEAVKVCELPFRNYMDKIGNTSWCMWDRVKSHYNKFTVCTESMAENLCLPWPNQLVKEHFVDIHTYYFQECPTETLRDPPPNVVLALAMTPICLIPAMVVLVVLKTKNGDRRS